MEDSPRVWMEGCRELPTIREAQEKRKFRRFITGDDSWFPLEFHHSVK
jgi:hypothetical protein